MSIEKAAEVIQSAEAILIGAGAGMGVDSGLPDFRGNEGFWNAYPPYRDKGLQFTDMANPGWFQQDPSFAWGFYGHRLNLYRQTTPHDGFKILKKWAHSKPGGAFVFTSNVDGQFQKAGFDSKQLLEVHGSIHHFQCLKDCNVGIIPADDFQVQIDESTMRAVGDLPQCPNCSALMRPNILMFGDWGWDGSRQEGQNYLYSNWLDKIRDLKLVIIECGAGTGIPTVRYESERRAGQLGGALIRINVREPQVSAGHFSISDGALKTLEAIDSLIE